MQITRTLTNIDTQEQHTITVAIATCAGGFTYQVLAETPTAVFTTADAAADAYVVGAQQRYEQQIIRERDRAARPCCHYCGQEVSANARTNLLGVYQCGECQ
jgi:hypothetical protein